jgi:adenylate kinase family enzyme
MSDDWRTDTKALTLQGASGGGKTTTARALHFQYPGPSIVFDLDEEPALGTEVRTVGELRGALDRGETEIVVRTPPEVIEDPDLFPDVVRFLMEIGNSLRGTDARLQFIIGEAQDVQERWVKIAAKRLRKRNVKPVIETQDPFSLSARIRTQAAYNAWVSPPSNKQAESMRGTNWPVDLLQELPEHDVLVFGDGWEPLARFRAGEEYAVE